MSKFRKKPVEIEAVKLHPWFMPENPLPSWLSEAFECRNVVLDEDGGFTVKTLEGDMRGAPGDWLVCGIKGELYPCKPDIFVSTYEPVK